jgi:hypothetical protein
MKNSERLSRMKAYFIEAGVVFVHLQELLVGCFDLY